MDFLKSAFIIGLLSVIVTSASFFKTRNNLNAPLFAIRWVHSAIMFFNLFYIFLFDKKYDLIYLILFNFIIVHWIFFKNECALSYLEKKILDKNYKLGNEIFSHPFTDILFDHKVMYVVFMIQLATYVYVSYRFFKRTYPRAMLLVVPVSLVMMSISTYNFFVPPSKRSWSSIS
jgi:hypothetical protein